MSPNMLREQTDRFWFSHRNNQIIQAAEALTERNDPTPMRTLLASRFEAGARWNMVETAALNPYVSRFLEMCMLLGFADETVSTADQTSRLSEDGAKTRD
jgi:hypothetical protein